MQKLAVREHIASCLLWVCISGSAPGFPAPVITFISVFPCHWAAGFRRQGTADSVSLGLPLLSCAPRLSSLGGEESSFPSPWKTPSPGCSSRNQWEGREFWPHRKCHEKKTRKKATDRRENLSSDSCVS